MTTIRAFVDRFLPRGAIVLSVLTFGSYGMGLVRDRIFARTYGAGAALDAYNAAFVLPELLFDVFIAAGLAAPFVPIFLKLDTEDDGAAGRFARTILTLAVVTMGAAALVLFVSAPLTIDFIAPGFQTADQRQLYTDLFRVMCVTPLIFATSIVLGCFLPFSEPSAYPSAQLDINETSRSHLLLKMLRPFGLAAHLCRLEGTDWSHMIRKASNL